jgi:putative hydrolase of the HAD superfamily
MDTNSLWDDIEGIVLDAVGTLIEAEPPVADVYLAAARRQGVALDRSEVRARFRRCFEDDEADESLGPMATNEALESRRWRRIVGNVLPEAPDPERAFAELWEHFARPSAWRCFPDVGPAVRALAVAGVPARIASNFDGRLRRVVAGLPELAALRDALVISSEVGYRKPHPRFYQDACARLGLPPGRVLFVGDDPENDVRGPARAGLRGALIDRSRSGGVSGAVSFPDLKALLAARAP